MKITLIIGLALSTILVFIGAIFKLQSWTGGGYFLTIGLVGEVISIAGLVGYLLTTSKEPDAVLELDPDKIPTTVEEVEEELRNDNDQYV